MPVDFENILTLDPDLKEKSEKKSKLKKPSMWNVVLLNDDFTPMEFVVLVLQQVFHKTAIDANIIMMEVHSKGKGLAGTFTLEIAEQKCIDTMTLARRYEFPLLVQVEKIDG